MELTDWMLYKLIGLGCLAFFGNLFYSLFTGKLLSEVRSGKEDA